MHFFYPGPAQLYAQVPVWTAEIFSKGLVSFNHRSPQVVECYKQAVQGIYEKLSVPESYTVVFTSSATECWEILGQSFAGDQFVHVFNGSFGAKWATINQQLGNRVHSISFALEEPPPVSSLPAADWICLTHCETSNGTYLPENEILAIKSRHPQALLALDATSSMAGIAIPWQVMDFVFASVQKCFGLPSGMAVLICSPQAVERALQKANTQHYNSLAVSLPLAKQYQPTHTPNILGICLLMKLMQEIESIGLIDQRLRKQAQEWYNWLEEHGFTLLVKNPAFRSPTVIVLQAEAKEINHLKQCALQHGIVLGNGYGPWKETTVRIANFPAIDKKSITVLEQFLLTFQATKKNLSLLP
ncbi:MAG: aminotransferase class V-fold PLP-dependent enzyme [Cytophagales bacterium]|nr:aminotransferase class V-fold PLP-dependent enzyme [Bernardetiaceae bacterium]MDW8210333.1 aminotransferase class V-fold PLP-dependent enzyme [Cytophagales bacterium]